MIHDALDFPVPLREIEPGIHMLELFHGPTHAFKDVGARFVAATNDNSVVPEYLARGMRRSGARDGSPRSAQVAPLM